MTTTETTLASELFEQMSKVEDLIHAGSNVLRSAPAALKPLVRAEIVSLEREFDRLHDCWQAARKAEAAN